MIAEPKPPSGLSSEASWHRQLLRWVKGWFVLSIEGYRVTETTGGRVFKKESVSVIPSTSFTQVPGMHPFRIYKPNLSSLMPNVYSQQPTGVIFDSSGNPSSIAIDFTTPTNLPVTVNPTTDGWRFYAIRNGIVEVRPFYGSTFENPDDSSDFSGTRGMNNYAGGMDIFLKVNGMVDPPDFFCTDGITPSITNPIFSDPPSFLDYDDSTTSIFVGFTGVYKSGQVLVYTGTGGDFCPIWIQILFDGIPVIRMAQGGDFPDSSPLVIPLGIIWPEPPGVDAKESVVQILSGHIIGRWQPGMYSDGEPSDDAPLPGALTWRGNWQMDDITDQMFYPGDVISATSAGSTTVSKNYTISGGGGGNVTVNLNYLTTGLYMMTGIGFTSDPTTDPNFISILKTVKTQTLT
jgi:hypothetical protein